MSYEAQSLFSLARNKLQSVVGGNVKDSSSLHRWVLLKNSIVRSHTSTPEVVTVSTVTYVGRASRSEDESCEEEQDTFLFPDPVREASLLGESQWLDSLLQELAADEEEATSSTTQQPIVTEEEEPSSPLYSPMSSSDDLVDQSEYYPYPYPLPYPPLQPPLVPAWYELEGSADSTDSVPATPTLSTLYDNTLPYYPCDDDLEDPAVPDAIDDLSDDESDAPLTPSTASDASISPPGPTSLSMPRERTRLPLASHPQVYVETDEPSYYSFDVDPLPFPHDSPVSQPAGVFRHTYAESC
ncbi:hypothetical protein BDW22DRAFT_385029 [Trametopsis cervina]|nr:hypothetical protein BDW22DRAFT_385029 [Trametopsis cervina]